MQLVLSVPWASSCQVTTCVYSALSNTHKDGAARVCYAKGWEREHEGGECLYRRRALHCVVCTPLSASGRAQPVAGGDSPLAEGAESLH